MPTVFIAGYKFRFYSSDEPPYVHVIHDDNEAKIWLEPVQLEYNRGYTRTALNRVLKLTEQNQARLLEAWHEYFDR
jgi:Domain of unknown function (DUF4160)